MPIDDTFYRAFEEKFRGSEEEIKKRLEFYIPLLKVYAEAYPSSKPKALDIGCGRGEMLSIYEDYGFEAFGIDINKVVLEETRSKGFNVAYADALDFLKSQKQDTYDVISLIHVLEHLPFEYAFELHKEVLRVLKPGGTYIAEFPFAENLTVGTIGFWTDPTHLKPLHPETVAFSLSYLGFTETLYFGVNGGVKDLKDAALTDIITNYVAPDVVVVGIKPTENRFFIEKIKTALDYLKSKSSYRLWDILTSASNNIEKRIKEDIENLILSNNLEIEKRIKEDIENLILSNNLEIEKRIKEDIENLILSNNLEIEKRIKEDIENLILSNNLEIEKRIKEDIENLILSNNLEIEKRIKEDIENLINIIYNQNNIIENLNEHITNLKAQSENIKQELDDKFNSLNVIVLFVKSQIEMLTFSKPWRIYAFLGKIKSKIIKKKIENTSNPDKVDNEVSVELPDVRQDNVDNIETNNEDASIPPVLSPVAKKIYNKLKAIKIS